MYAVLIGHLCVMDKRGSAIVTHEKWGAGQPYYYLLYILKWEGVASSKVIIGLAHATSSESMSLQQEVGKWRRIIGGERRQLTRVSNTRPIAPQVTITLSK